MSNFNQDYSVPETVKLWEQKKIRSDITKLGRPHELST